MKGGVWEGTHPLGTGSAAVDAFVVLVGFGDFEELGAGFGVDFPHFGTHCGGSVGGKRRRWRCGGIWRMFNVSNVRWLVLSRGVEWLEQGEVGLLSSCSRWNYQALM